MRNLILLFFTLIACGASGQVSGGINDGLNYGLTLIPTIEKGPGEIVGSPYFNEEFSRGVVNIAGKDSLEAYIRYNVAEERMEIKTHLESPRIYQLPSSTKAEYILGSKKFVLDKITGEEEVVYGYFVELHSGENYRLLKKPIARFTEGEKARTGYGKDKPGRITIEEEFYVVPESGKAVSVRPRTRDLKKAFRSAEAQDYLKDNKIRSEADLTAFVAHLD